jgi:EAL domain-containing protein (putative c-di-GMP-specific phosphodiesterase class I)
MANPSDPTLLLVAGSAPLPALASALRETFPEASIVSVEGETALREALSKAPRAVVLSESSTASGLTLETIARLIADAGGRARLLALGASHTPAEAAQVMTLGARDLVSLRESLHLRLTIARELEVLPAFRERNLRTNTEEASALMDGEELIWASDAFARLLGRTSPAQISGRGLWICIDAEDHHGLRRCLQGAVSGISMPVSQQIRVIAPDGKRLRLAFGLGVEPKGDKTLVRIHAMAAQPAAAGERAPPQINVEVLKRLRTAMAANGLAIAVQPITPLAAAAGSDERLDVLIRIKDATGELAAAEFMREASSAGLLKSMDHWVVRHACAMAAKSGRNDILYFLRIARQTLQDAATLQVVRGAIATHRVLPGNLSFELPEAEFASLFPDERSLLFALKKDGCRLTLSQFGARPESLETLDRLSLDYVKLDHKLTGEAANSQATRETLRTLVQKAESRKVHTISTRVADATSLAELWKLGVNYVQGFYVHEPEIVVGA